METIGQHNTTVDVLRELRQNNKTVFTFINMEENDSNYVRVKVLVDSDEHEELKTPENLVSFKVADKCRYYLKFKVTENN